MPIYLAFVARNNFSFFVRPRLGWHTIESSVNSSRGTGARPFAPWSMQTSTKTTDTPWQIRNISPFIAEKYEYLAYENDLWRTRHWVNVERGAWNLASMLWPFRHVIVLFVDVRASMNWAELNFELLYIEFVMIQKCNNSSVLNDTNNGPSNAPNNWLRRYPSTHQSMPEIHGSRARQTEPIPCARVDYTINNRIKHRI